MLTDMFGWFLFPKAITDQMLVQFSIRLFHRGVPDELSHQIIRDLESSRLSIQRIKWWH